MDRFKAKLRNLEARCEFFDNAAEVANLRGAQKIDGLPSLRIEATGKALDIVLTYVHDQEAPADMHSFRDRLAAYELAHLWSASGVLRDLRQRLPCVPALLYDSKCLRTLAAGSRTLVLGLFFGLWQSAWTKRH